MALTMPGQALYWGDLTGEPFDIEEVVEAKPADTEYFKKMQEYRRVDGPGSARWRIPDFGCLWTDVELEEGTHGSRLVAKEENIQHARIASSHAAD